MNHTVKLPPTAARIFAAVFDTMQQAEEIGGPEHQEYIALMDAIKCEADERAANAIQSMIDEAAQTHHRPHFNAQALAHARRMVAQWSVADTREQLAALYLDWIGYDPMKEFEDATPMVDEMRDSLNDYIREVCYSTGVPVALAGLTD